LFAAIGLGVTLATLTLREPTKAEADAAQGDQRSGRD
jgi:hypothetical protein